MSRAVGSDGEPLRALLPVGYAAGVAAYRAAAEALTADDLSLHYTRGLTWFHEAFVPALTRRLEGMAQGAWSFAGWRAYAAGSDVDLVSHVVNAVTDRHEVALYPGDWHGFRVGAVRPDRIRFDAEARAALACLCVPSVRNGHLEPEMVSFLERSDHCLLNLNLWPTLTEDERVASVVALRPVLERSLLSISFSRGFGLTASQLGVLLVPPGHPLAARFDEAWRWHTYFYNAIAARAFLEVEPDALLAVDRARRAWVAQWLAERGLPAIETGSYYVRSFRVEGPLPEVLRPLARADVVRLCPKPYHLL